MKCGAGTWPQQRLLHEPEYTRTNCGFLARTASTVLTCRGAPCGRPYGWPSRVGAPLMGAQNAAASAVKRATTRVAPIGANLPNWALIDTFPRRFAEMTLKAFCGGAQCLCVGLGGNGVDQRLDDHAQQAPNTVFYAASRRGESPRCSAMSGSVNRASKRWQRMYALALLGSSPGGPARPMTLLRCLKAISMRHRNR